MDEDIDTMAGHWYVDKWYQHADDVEDLLNHIGHLPGVAQAFIVEDAVHRGSWAIMYFSTIEHFENHGKM